MRRLGAALVLAASLARIADAPAAGPESAAAPGPIVYTPPAWPEQPSAGSLLVRLLVAAGFVVVAGGAACLAARRLAPRARTGAGDGRLRLVENLPLGDGSSLHLLEWCGRRFVAGVSRGGFRSLVAVPESFENELEALAGVE